MKREPHLKVKIVELAEKGSCEGESLHVGVMPGNGDYAVLIETYAGLRETKLLVRRVYYEGDCLILEDTHGRRQRYTPYDQKYLMILGTIGKAIKLTDVTEDPRKIILRKNRSILEEMGEIMSLHEQEESVY